MNVALALVLASLAGLPQAAADTATGKVAELGPVKAWVELVPAKPRLSDLPKLTVVIDAADGVKVEQPPFADTFSGFAIRDVRDVLPEVKGGRQRLSKVYTLEPQSSGALTILPIPIHFTDARPNGDGQEHLLETEPLSVEVTSLVGKELPDLGELAQGEGPVEVPGHLPLWLTLGAGGLLAVAACAGAIVLWRRHRRPPAPLSSTEIAQRELDALLAREQSGALDLKEFYVELTAIVRRHVERTTAVHAPEQTTGEFLRAIQGHPAFDALRRDRLAAFLESADLVKFAGHQPDRAAVATSIERAREFIRLFAPQAAPAAAPMAAAGAAA
jgi:hypothetical protein